MPINGYFDVPFADSGSKVAVPDAVQPDGSVSYSQGYGVNYTLDPATNPSALNVENTKMNQLFFDVTSALQQYQRWGVPPFITTTMNGGSPYSYPKYAMALESGVAYMSLEAANADTPPSPKWMALDFRRRLTADANYYVSASSGSDSNPGTSGAPWLTIQHAVDHVARFVDLAGYNATINVADGSYAPFSLTTPFVGKSGGVSVVGNATTPSNCVVASSSNGVDCISVAGNGAILSVSGFRLTTSNNANAASAVNGGVLNIVGNMNFGAVNGSNSGHLVSSYGGRILIQAGYTISGAALSHYYGNFSGSIISSSGLTMTLTGSPAFTSFANMQNLSLLAVIGATFSGTAAGVRYSVSTNSVIQTSGGGANYLPGNSAGVVGSGGQYV